MSNLIGLKNCIQTKFVMSMDTNKIKSKIEKEGKEEEDDNDDYDYEQSNEEIQLY